MLGDAWSKDKADAVDLLRACARSSACQLTDESSTLPRCRKEREARFARTLAVSDTASNGEVQSHGRRAVGEVVRRKSHERFSGGIDGAASNRLG